jgi:hypothetical protein
VAREQAVFGTDTPILRGVNVQHLFGSKCALRTVENFTEFEQRAAYFDGDPVIATRKGMDILERGSQIHAMAEFEELLNFPPAPKLTVLRCWMKARRHPRNCADRRSSLGRQMRRVMWCLTSPTTTCTIYRRSGSIPRS